MSKANLNDPSIMAASEATRKWGLDESSLRKRIESFPEGTIRKFGKQWVVTEEGMTVVFGIKKEKDD